MYICYLMLRQKKTAANDPQPIRFFLLVIGLGKNWPMAFWPNSIPHERPQIRTQLQTFKQRPFESFYEAWERFKDLQLSCPHHQIPNWLLAQSFYEGLFDEHKSSINAACGGDIPGDLLRLFETMAKNGFSCSNDKGPVSQGNNAESETIKALTK